MFSIMPNAWNTIAAWRRTIGSTSMISGTRPAIPWSNQKRCDMKKLLISVLCLFASALAFADEPPTKDFKLEQLLQLRAQVKGGRATFVETHVQPTFDMTTIISGVLLYQAPDRLERQNLKPSTDRAVIEGDKM